MTPPRTPPEPVPSDYDENPDRMHLARSVIRRHVVAAHPIQRAGAVR